MIGNQTRQTGFPDAWRSIENQRSEPIGFDRAAQEFSFTEDVFLPKVLGQCLGPHARRQRHLNA